jgi:hypothetical protein
LQLKVNEHNNKRLVWQGRSDDIKNRGAVLVGRIRNWEKRNETFVATVEEALGNSTRTTVLFQAQGDDMKPEKFEKSDVPGPLCVGAAIDKLMDLKEKLTTAELRQRDQAIERAVDWMKRIALQGGIRGYQRPKSFYNDNRRDDNARIDIQVLRGHAFVECPVLKE